MNCVTSAPASHSNSGRSTCLARRICRGQITDAFVSPKGFGFVTFANLQDAFNFLEVGR